MSGEFTEVGRSLKDLDAKSLLASKHEPNGDDNVSTDQEDQSGGSDSKPIRNVAGPNGTINKAAIIRRALREPGVRKLKNKQIAAYIYEHYDVYVSAANVSTTKAYEKSAKRNGRTVRTHLPRGIGGNGNGNGTGHAGSHSKGVASAQKVLVKTAGDGVLSQEDILAARDFSQAVGNDLPRALRALQFYTQLVGESN